MSLRPCWLLILLAMPVRCLLAQDAPTPLRGISHLRFTLTVSRARPLFGEPFSVYVGIWNPLPKPVEVPGLIRDVHHAILRVEVEQGGRFVPIEFGTDPCWSVVADAYAQHGRIIPRPKHAQIPTTLEPYEMNHQWVWNARARLPGNKSAVRAPGKYRIRLSYHDKPVAGPVDVVIRDAPASLEPLLRRINGRFLPGMSLAEDELAVLKQVVAGLPHNDEARPTFEFFRDSYGGRYDRTAREAAWERLRAFPKRFPEFHLRHLMYQRVANLYADPRNPTSREQPMQKHYLDLYNKEWPRHKKPAADDRR